MLARALWRFVPVIVIVSAALAVVYDIGGVRTWAVHLFTNQLVTAVTQPTH